MWPFMALALFLQTLQFLQILPMPFSSNYVLQLNNLSWPEAQKLCGVKATGMVLAVVDEILDTEYNKTLDEILRTITNPEQKPELVLTDKLRFWVGNSQSNCTPPGTDDIITTSTTSTSSTTTDMEFSTENSTSTTSIITSTSTTSTTTPTTTIVSHSSTSTNTTDETTTISTPNTTTILTTTTTMRPICEYCNYLELMEVQNAKPTKIKTMQGFKILKTYVLVPRLKKCGEKYLSICEKRF